MTPYLAFDGFWEMWLTMALAQLVRPGSVCVDVGANVGYYTALMADLAGPRGRVHAVEPCPSTRKILERTVLANGPGGTVKIHPYAAGAEEKAVKIGLHPHNVGGASVDGLQPDSTVWADARQVTLDSLKLGHADIIKIDAEGMDFAVLRGAEKLLSGDRTPVVFAEYIPEKWGHDEGGLRFMENLGYALYEIDGAGQFQRLSVAALLSSAGPKTLAWRTT
jgi:FkbM family methyltransferase